MKRLIKKAEPITLYHGTNLLSLDEILQTGIAAGMVGNSPWHDTTSTQTFYTTDIELSIWYGKEKYQKDGSRNKDGIVVIQIDFDTDYLEPDKDDTDATTWEESNETHKQVAFSGSVMANQIKYLYFYNNQQTLIHECAKESYLSDPEAIKQNVYLENTKNKDYEVVEDDVLAEQILYNFKEIGNKVDKCHQIVFKYERTRKYDAKMIQETLDEIQDKIVSLVEDTNKTIKQYIMEGGKIPLIEVTTEKYTVEPHNSYELNGYILEWFDSRIYTLPDKKTNRYSVFFENFVNHLKEKKQQDKTANKKRLQNIVR